METLHIKLEPEETLSSKKNLLATEINLLNSIKHLQNYKKHVLEELRSKTLLKSSLREIALDILELNKILPQIKEPKPQVDKQEEKISSKNLEQELKDIREKLER